MRRPTKWYSDYRHCREYHIEARRRSYEMSKMRFAVGTDKRTLTVRRTFSAPKSKVWQAFANPALLAQWWGPRGWETEIKHMDFSDGGYWHYGMRCTDIEQSDWYGKASWGRATYKNITPQESFEYTDAFCDENGKIAGDMPVARTIVELTESEGATTVTSTTVYETTEALAQVLEMGMREGLTQTWDKLEELVEN